MSTEIESLELKITSDATRAAKGIDALTQSLKKVKSATKGGLGLSSLSTQLRSVSKDGKDAGQSFTDMYHRMKVITNGVKKVVGSIYSAVKKSSEYIENVNLFTVSMGKYADEAKKYAEEVGEVMGIDPGEWMRSQGVFMTLATGFGVAGDRAAVMSKNLTQLGYDLSSFFNISYEDAMQKLQSGLSGELEPLRRIGYDLSHAKLEATALELGIDKAVSSMTQAEKAELRYYAIMTQVTTAHGDMARTLDAPANQLKLLKSQVNMAAREIGNVFIPMLNAILPYAIAVTKVVRNLASSLASFVGYEMPEVDYSGVETMSTVAEDTSAALEDSVDSAKKLKSYMMGFDELNVINPGASDTLGGTSDFTFELPEYKFFDEEIETKVGNIVETIERSLAEIFSIVSGASLAMGAVLTFSGINIPLGLGLMALGATGLVANAAVNWKSMENPVETILGTLTGMVGGALLATGAILAFTGINIPLGLAMMAGGAVSLVTALAMNWDSLSEPVKQTIGTLEGIVGGGLLALGAILAFTGANIPMGVALMVSGAVSLASAVALNWDSLTGDVSSTLETITYIVSGALLGVGAILAFTGANIPLGIGLMAVGAVTLGTAIAMNTSALSDEVQNVIAVIAAAVSGALLAVGAILAFTGANIPLGIALMAGGALTLGTAIVPNWSTLSDSVSETITAIMSVVGAAILALGAILAFSGVNIPLGIGLMVGGAASLASVVALNWESLTGNVESTVSTLTTIVSGALLGLGAVLAFTGANIPLGIALMAVGAVTLGTAVALNTSALSDEVAGVIATIASLVSVALLVVGAVLAFTGANIPLGIALMAGGALTMGTAIAPNWNSLTDSVQETISTITAIVGEASLVVGAILAFSGINIPLGIGLMLVGAASLATMAALNWGSLQELLQGPVGDITSVVGGASLALGALLAFSGAALPLGIALMVLGAAGLATGIAANWNTIVDALKGPIGLITGFVSAALLALGVLLCISGVGIPLGIALIAAGAVGLATVVALNWDTVVNAIKTVVASILAIISGAMLVMGVLLLLSGAGVGLGLALIFGALKLSETAWKMDDNPITNFVKNMANGIIKIMNKVIDFVNEIFHIEIPGWSVGGVEIIPAINKRLINIPKIPLMAEGGFPEQGQMFIAREAGAEMVGNIGRRTAVANNDQIVSGIAGGVAQANEEQNALLREQNSLLRSILEKDSGVYLDGKSITNSVEKHQRERGRVLISGGVM